MKSAQRLATLSTILVLAVGTIVACGSDSGQDDADSGAGGSSASSSGGAQAHDGAAAAAASDGTVNWDKASPEVTTSDGFDEVCAAMTKQAVLEPANLLFVVDRTGSLNCNPPPTMTTAECEQTPAKKDPAQPSKWEIVRDSLKAAVSELEKVQPLPSVGIMYFNADDHCGFPSQPSVDVVALTGDDQTDPQLAAFTQSIDAVTPKGDTPIVGTMYSAYTYLQQAALTGNKFVILLTDGAETCDANNKPTLLQWAADATLINIRTFVLGAPGSEVERAFLSQVAYNGGTASSPACDHAGAPPDQGNCHMDMTLPGMDFKTELTKNLAAISGQAMTCAFDVPQPEPGQPEIDLNTVNVEYTSGSAAPVTIPQDNAHPCSSPDNQGWQYASNNKQIVLCGQACEQVKTDPLAKISIEMGCRGTEIIK